MAMAKRIHIPKPPSAGGSEGLFADPLLWCGLVGNHETPYTRRPHEATCAECRRRNKLHVEEPESGRANK